MSWSESAHSGKPRRKSGLSCTLRVKTTHLQVSVLFLVCWFCATIVVSGCGSTAPRFKSGESKSSTSSSGTKATAPKKDSARPRDEDVEASSEEAETVMSGNRSFETEKNTAISNLNQAKMMREISKMMGVSYKLGGENEDGIDCSAYTMNVYKNSIGKQLPRNSTEQFKMGTPVTYEDLKFGDLVFFNTTGDPASHVGIYLGDDLFAHASVSLGVTISSLESFYYKKRYEGARRLVQ